ncbi:MAG: response regulator transcription factor [Candidatus Melainabacteria bacterium]|nr:response regulator transcription factor [Candidatus Melainabacteria bacterium]
MSKILLVEDESDLAMEVKEWLSREKYLVEVLDNGQAASDTLHVAEYDLIILDWQLPGLSGVEICRTYRSRGGTTPVLILTARTSVDDRETGLDSGADDYLCKPFALKELSARVRALLRRTSAVRTSALSCRDILLEPRARKVSRAGNSVHLEPKEFALLEFFMRHPDTVFSAETLLARVWESDTEASPEAIRTYIRGLRKKLDDRERISTVHGLGYRFNS